MSCPVGGVPLEAVRARLARRAVALVRPQVWVVDDTGFPKDGVSSPAGRQTADTPAKPRSASCARMTELATFGGLEEAVCHSPAGYFNVGQDIGRSAARRPVGGAGSGSVPCCKIAGRSVI
ncbi:transposase [Streptomyces luteogriseus]|nr:transposase [Streptomyces luteogriseus]WTJ32649.1 transposase [Streptomyces luteogriseus]